MVCNDTYGFIYEEETCESRRREHRQGRLSICEDGYSNVLRPQVRRKIGLKQVTTYADERDGIDETLDEERIARDA